MQADRRKEPRHVLDNVAGLRLTPQDGELKGRALMAELADASEGGLGVETFVELASGVRVEIRADMRNSEMALNVTGVARVAHCREMEPGRYRIGLDLIEVKLERAA